MTAREEYEKWTPPEAGLSGIISKYLADAALAEADARILELTNANIGIAEERDEAEADVERLKKKLLR